MDAKNAEYWFPAKRYGWGWGFPCAWQGWVVMTAWLAILIITAILLSTTGLFWFWPVAALIEAAGLVAICWWKGEPPRWRWGN